MCVITKTEKSIQVESEYNRDFISGARNLAGRWNSPHWTFDVRDEGAVRELCLDVYGTDGETVDLVDVEITFEGGFYATRGPITFCGRTIARAFGRDSGAKPGAGVVVKSGGFRSSGSVKNWATEVNTGGAVVVLRDMSRRAVEAVDAEEFGGTFEILEPENKNAALIAERDRLIARLAEIDDLLGDHQ